MWEVSPHLNNNKFYIFKWPHPLSSDLIHKKLFLPLESSKLSEPTVGLNEAHDTLNALQEDKVTNCLGLSVGAHSVGNSNVSRAM